MRTIFLALLILCLFATVAQAAPCENCQRPVLFSAGCQCGAACQCATGECGDLSCPSRARILGAAPVQTALRGARRCLAAPRAIVRKAACGVRRVVQNRPRLLRRFAARVFGGCR